MPPKAAKGKTTKKKSSKPEWMSDDVWAVTQDLPLLFNSFAGIKSDKPAKSGKTDRPATPSKPAAKGGKPEPPPPIPKAQVSQTWTCIFSYCPPTYNMPSLTYKHSEDKFTYK